MLLSESNALHVPPSARVGISVNSLKVEVGSKDTESGSVPILDSISLNLEQSNMMAIMGGSGSGKTTLLNVLAQRTNVNTSALKFSGSVTYTFPESAGKSRISSAYMVQQDFFMPGLTLEETLGYQAELKLGSSTKQERTELIDTLLSLLELDHRRKEIVKSFTEKINLSGGEQRRATLAIQLLSRPQILFLDEPTTGLDTSSALTLVSVLKKLASPEIGITIILSIHQPRAEVISLFDKLCVLTRGGRLIYYGSLMESVEHYAGLEEVGIVGKSRTSFDSVAAINKLMAISVKDTSTAEKDAASSRVTDALVSYWNTQHPAAYSSPSKESDQSFQDNLKIFKPTKPLPLHKEIYVLTRRSALISIRDKVSLIGLHGGGTILAVALGWLFFKPTPDLAGIRSLTSCLYAVIESVGFAPLAMEVARLWAADGVHFIREYRDKRVSIVGFVISRRISKLFIEDVPFALIFSIITYFMWGLRHGKEDAIAAGGHFFGIYFVILLMVVICSMSLALLCFALSNSFALCLLFINIIYQIQSCGCGYFINAATMPVYVRWVKYVAFFWYAFGGLTSNQFTNWKGHCPYDVHSGQCLEFSGNYQLRLLGFPRSWSTSAIGYLSFWLIGFNVLVMAVLSCRSYEVGMAKKKKNRIGEEFADDEISESTEMTEISAVTENPFKEQDGPSIQAQNVTLCVKVKTSQNVFASRESRVLLDDVTADFKSNAVNVIMGPSGSGKTTFLNFLAARLGSSSFSSNGKILLNNFQEVSPVKLSKLAAYVTQIDNLLIPHLTVRETLYYQACLRLPASQHKSIPMQLNHIMRQTGLIDCADTPIGSEEVKGISGGEKRRVSIAIQLLGKPKVLYLDEPTSGLDSATSAAILSLLKELALSGTTIITTLHQPNEEMFCQFDTLTLLARGGHVVFNGSTESLPVYLSSVGHECPQHCNIADHALDLLSLGLNETSEQLQSRIEYLIQQWKENRILNESKVVDGPEIDFENLQRPEIPWAVLFKTVIKRQFVVSFRDENILLSRLFTAIALGVVLAIFFAPLKNNQVSISNRLGLIQSVVNLYYCGLVNSLTVYPAQRDLFHQEYKDNLYGMGIFQGAYLLVELPFEIFPGIIFSALVVFGVGLPRTASMFFAMLFCSVFVINCGEAAGIFFNSIFLHMGLVSNVLANVFMIGLFMAGTMSLQMPKFFRAWNYINPTKYLVEICTNMAFKGQTFKCPKGRLCSLTSGTAVLEEYGLTADIRASFGAFVACVVLYRLISISVAYLRVKKL